MPETLTYQEASKLVGIAFVAGVVWLLLIILAIKGIFKEFLGIKVSLVFTHSSDNKSKQEVSDGNKS